MQDVPFDGKKIFPIEIRPKPMKEINQKYL